jgi:protein phosphatase 1L
VDGARGGFGLTAEPHVTVETLTPEDQLIILGTDGLWELGNQLVVDICLVAGETTPLDEIMKKLVKVAQEKGVTDDIAGIVIRL